MSCKTSHCDILFLMSYETGSGSKPDKGDVSEAWREPAKSPLPNTMQGERTNELSALTNGSRQRFLNVLSHELRTPLTPVLAAAELLASPFTLSDAEVKKNGELIRRNILLEV